MQRKRPPEPWRSFFDEVDKASTHAVSLHCLGGFALAMLYGLPRPTIDVDCLTVIPVQETTNFQFLAGKGSALHSRYGLYAQHVAMLTGR